MKQLNNLKRKIDPLLKDFLAPKKDQFPKGTIYDEMVEQIIDLIFRPGAERLRPILVYFGYKLFSNIQSPISDQRRFAAISLHRTFSYCSPNP